MSPHRNSEPLLRVSEFTNFSLASECINLRHLDRSTSWCRIRRMRTRCNLWRNKTVSGTQQVWKFVDIVEWQSGLTTCCHLRRNRTIHHGWLTIYCQCWCNRLLPQRFSVTSAAMLPLRTTTTTTGRLRPWSITTNLRTLSSWQEHVDRWWTLEWIRCIDHRQMTAIWHVCHHRWLLYAMCGLEHSGSRLWGRRNANWWRRHTNGYRSSSSGGVRWHGSRLAMLRTTVATVRVNILWCSTADKERVGALEKCRTC